MDSKEMKQRIEKTLKQPVKVDASESLEIKSDMYVQIATEGHSTEHLVKPLNSRSGKDI